MKKQKPLRLGIVGCGVIAHVHGRAARNSDRNIHFVACCDIREGSAVAWAKEYSCKAYYTDYVQMIEEEELDGIVLATWPNQHQEQIQQCLAAGIENILCEKALALTGQEANEIMQTVEDNNAFLMEGFMYRHHPAISRMFELVATGELGHVDCVHAYFSAFDAEESLANDKTRDWRQRRECGGGVPYDFACYCVNACSYFAGGIPSRIYARGDVSERYDTINRVHALLEYSNGCVGMIESSKQSDCSQRLEVVCSHGRLVLPIAWTIPGKIELIEERSSGWVTYETIMHTIASSNPYRLQLDNFADVVRGIAKPVLPLRESIMNTFALEAMVKSLQERQIVDISLPDGYGGELCA